MNRRSFHSAILPTDATHPNIRSSNRTSWRIGLLGVGVLWTGAVMAAPSVAGEGTAATLRENFATLHEQLDHNAFKLPLHLDSTQTDGGVRGDIHAILAYPFATMCTALKGAPQWCDILLLHLNVKYCRAVEDAHGSRLIVYIGRKHEQPLDDAYRVEFEYKVALETADYRHVQLVAEKGPVGTRDYRIMLEAMPLDHGRTFIHLSYSYSFGLAARFATQAYFSTMGSAKVGFTVLRQDSEGRPVYVDDMRAALERNTMRYFLAIDAYMGALSAPPSDQFERRLHAWFVATERYPLQLHEETEIEYLAMKRNENRRQQEPVR